MVWTRLAQEGECCVRLWRDENEPALEPGLGLTLPERSRCELWIENATGGSIRAWITDQEYTSHLRQMGSGTHWAIDWRDYVGLSGLRVEVNGQTVLDLPVEIRSLKIGYQDDYRQLLDELTDWLVALVFSVATPTTLPTILLDRAPGSPYLDYLVVRSLMQDGRLPSAFERVRRDPHRLLVREERRVDFEQAQHVGVRTLLELTRSADLVRSSATSATVARQLRGWVPLRLVDIRPRTDYDTPENRFVGYLLRALARHLLRLERAFEDDAAQHAGRAQVARLLASDCRRWGRRVGEMMRAPFLETVGPMSVFPASSQVLRRREGYRALRDAYQRLLLSPHVRWQGLDDLLAVPSRDVPQLYEYWCFFALADSLARTVGISPDWPSLIKWTGSVWQISLQPGTASRIRIGPATLWYNRGYGRPNSYSLPLRPDYSIELGGRLWLFDAKYRLEWQDVERALKEDDDANGDKEATFKRADLFKMHTYRDAIRDAEAVLILYPGAVFRAFDVNSDWPLESARDVSPGFAGVGALALRPGRTSDLDVLMASIVQGGERVERLDLHLQPDSC